MKRNLICIICPKGCSLTAEEINGKISVAGNTCPKGEKYAVDECTHPMRTVTSTIRVSNREDVMVSVKTENTVAKEDIFKVMDKIRGATAEAPLSTGDVIIKNICGTNIVATKSIK